MTRHDSEHFKSPQMWSSWWRFNQRAAGTVWHADGSVWGGTCDSTANTCITIPWYVITLPCKRISSNLHPIWMAECSSKHNRGVSEVFYEVARVSLTTRPKGQSGGSRSCIVMWRLRCCILYHLLTPASYSFSNRIYLRIHSQTSHLCTDPCRRYYRHLKRILHSTVIN
jgi:hypothetical protein